MTCNGAHTFRNPIDTEEEERDCFTCAVRLHSHKMRGSGCSNPSSYMKSLHQDIALIVALNGSQICRMSGISGPTEAICFIRIYDCHPTKTATTGSQSFSIRPSAPCLNPSTIRCPSPLSSSLIPLRPLLKLHFLLLHPALNHLPLLRRQLINKEQLPSR